MSVEAHKALIRRFVEIVWNRKEFDAIGEFYAAEFSQNGTPTTVEAMQQGLRDWLTNQLPDLYHTIDDIIAEGDKVAYHWTMRGTNRETGTPQEYRGNTFMRIEGGKIVEDWFTAEAVTDAARA